MFIDLSFNNRLIRRPFIVVKFLHLTERHFRTGSCTPYISKNANCLMSDLDEGCKSSFNAVNIPNHLQWIRGEAPGFSLCGDQIKVLLTPEEFYSALIDGCKKASSNISLAALYIGTGSLETNLVDVLDKRMTECGKNLNVSILLDAVRDSRDSSARTQLLPLIHNHPHCQVSLYHTPDLHGFWLKVLPTKINEVIGLQHIKMYVFDDDVIISGANLTKDYFTDRQDRYMLISRCQPLAEFCRGLIEQVSTISLRLTADNCLVPTSSELHPYLSPPSKFVEQARERVWGYYKKKLAYSDNSLKPGHDTWVFPLLQLPPLMVLQDSCVTQTLLESLPAQTTIHLASPYFNLPDEHISSFLHRCQAPFNILVPHPTSNDFFGARGFAGQIPMLYTELEDNFLQRVEESGQEHRFSILEYERSHGTFHSKGIWLTKSQSKDDCPYLTIIGSSNFNQRSVKRDLECQMVVVTNNRNLQQNLREEKTSLFKHGQPFSRKIAMRSDRKTKLWHKVFLWFFKGYF